MRVMQLEEPFSSLIEVERPIPMPLEGQLLLRVEACGVCRTDLHVCDGELPQARYPIVPGHEIVARVEACGARVSSCAHGQRVGVPWLGWTCGRCRYCVAGQENLCDEARFTGCDLDGGYAEYCVADARFCFPLPEGPAASTLAPLLCAGLIGYRALRLAGNAQRLGIYGFGAAAHIVAQLAHQDGREFLAFTRPGDADNQRFALSLGASWAGASDAQPPLELDAALIFAPAGELVPAALRQLRKGGIVVCAGIHMSDIPAFPYAILWGERQIRSVANLTRSDGEQLLSRIATQPVEISATPFTLSDANLALSRLRAGALQGAAVLIP
ncbi:MAG: zinc-dependent alcohol dehydrogenase family protein [Betaproteobacteria bacterium]|nr:zinc-dependent alcohol dehydrogenase family protein [Betaproteobacteria bacterium]